MKKILTLFVVMCQVVVYGQFLIIYHYQNVILKMEKSLGYVKHWDLNSVDFEIKNGKIKCFEAEFDYFELTKLLELTEIIYFKGSSDWTQQTTTKRNGKIETKHQNVTQKKKN